jgi:hypothetical protein
VSGLVGMWREVASLGGFGLLDRLTIRVASGAFGYGLGTAERRHAPQLFVVPPSSVRRGRSAPTRVRFGADLRASLSVECL